MNITFLVGNGFDVATGLHTGYKDFYDWYCNLPASENEDSSLQEFKKSIHEYVERVNDNEEKEQETWADFELGLGEYTEKFEKGQGNDFLLCREDAFSKLIEYLRKQQKAFDADSLSEEDIERIRMHLGKFYAELPIMQKERIEQLFQSVQNQNSKIRFVSFNYTEVLDKVVEKISNTPIRSWKYGSSNMVYHIDSQVLHVHGRLDEYPILAVNDEEQIKNKDLLSVEGFKETMIKSTGIETIGQDWYKKAEQMIDSSRIICIYGMSMGATDKKWWAQVADWLTRNSSNFLVIFQYFKFEISGTSIRQYVKNKNMVINKFLSHSDLAEDKKEIIRDRIHVVFNTKCVLQIKEKESLTV